MSNNKEVSGKRYVRSWKCQVSVGELYRWILAKLSDKDIKRALHKYRDLMPRQSDWNRKLTQATNIPELGFRYLYRCGQIDESNHRTMQKMLKYIDRQDVLPYFDTILYNTNYANYSLDELKANLLDKVEEFLKYSTSLSEEEVHPESVYEIHQCQSISEPRVTRSRLKRKIDEIDSPKCQTIIKRLKTSVESFSDASLSQCLKSASEVCGQVRSSIMAAGLAGPVIHSYLASSIISMLDALRVPNSNTFELGNYTENSSSLNPAGLLAALPHLLAFTDLVPAPFLRLIMTAARNSPRIDAFFLSSSSTLNAQLSSNSNNFRLSNNSATNVAEPVMAGPHNLHHHRLLNTNMGNQTNRGLTSAFSGGVGITASSTDSCLLYYCRLRMRIKLDTGSSPDLRSQVHVMRQGNYEQQLEIFSQASNILNSRSSGEFLCCMRFNQLNQLEAFWRDYQSGALRRFLTHILLDLSVPSFFQDGNRASTTTECHENSDKPIPDWLQGSSVFSEDPFTALMESLKEIRLQCQVTRSSTASFAPHQIPQQPVHIQAPQPVRVVEIPPVEQTARDLVSLHLYISRREYENGRALLMRNLRDIPSMSRLISASSYLPFLMPQMFGNGLRGFQTSSKNPPTPSSNDSS